MTLIPGEAEWNKFKETLDGVGIDTSVITTEKELVDLIEQFFVNGTSLEKVLAKTYWKKYLNNQQQSLSASSASPPTHTIQVRQQQQSSTSSVSTTPGLSDRFTVNDIAQPVPKPPLMNLYSSDFKPKPVEECFKSCSDITCGEQIISHCSKFYDYLGPSLMPQNVTRDQAISIIAYTFGLLFGLIFLSF